MKKKKHKRKKKKTKAEKIAAEMRRDKAFHDSMCDGDGKGKLRFGGKMAGITTTSKRKIRMQRGKIS